MNRKKQIHKSGFLTKSVLLGISGFFLLLFSTSAFANDIHQAVRARDIITLRKLLESPERKHINDKTMSGVTPLHIAAATDQDDIAKLLIDNGADINAKTLTGFTPLHWAASRDAIHTATLLINNDAEVSLAARNGITPLHWAASKNSTNVLQILINVDADLSAVTDTGLTPLHMAMKQSHGQSAVMLAEAKVDTEMKSPPQEALPDEPMVIADKLSDSYEPLPLEESPDVPRAVPGTFLTVPIGLGESLSFVWIEPLELWFGKYEVTNGEYKRFQRLHSSRSYQGFDLDKTRQPVTYVSWNDASAFCKWLNANFSARIPLDCEFRMPYEKEWNLVTSCATNRIYPWGDDWPPLYGNFSDITARENLSDWHGIRGYDDGYSVTSPVEDSNMNDWGIFGLAGNVAEWCTDWYDKEQIFKTRKGGSWDFDPQDNLRISARGLDRPDARYDTIGIRLIVAKREQ